MLLKPAKNSGFTLLEIVVAVAIFGVITAIIFPALLQFLEMRERVNEKHQTISALQKTFLFMANDLRYAVNRLSKDEYGEMGKTTIKLNEDALIEFTAAYPDLSLQGLSVPRRVRWQLDDGVLQRLQWPVMDPEADTRRMVQSLLAKVESVEIEVSQVKDGRSEESSRWEEQTRLPDMVEIVIQMEGNLEYRRVFSMLGADQQSAVKAGASVQDDAAAPNDGQDPANVPAAGNGSNPGGIPNSGGGQSFDSDLNAGKPDG